MSNTKENQFQTLKNTDRKTLIKTLIGQAYQFVFGLEIAKKSTAT